MPMLEFTNGLYTSILKISMFPNPTDLLKMLSWFLPKIIMIILAVLTAKLFRRWRPAKNNKIANQCLPFLPMAKYSRDFRAHSIKRITDLKNIMTKDNVLFCTTIFSTLKFLRKFAISY